MGRSVTGLSGEKRLTVTPEELEILREILSEQLDRWIFRAEPDDKLSDHGRARKAATVSLAEKVRSK